MPQVDLHQYLAEIREMLSQGRYTAAAAHCRHILAAYPRHVDSYRLLAKALLSQKKYDDATDIYQRVLSADPLDTGARVGLATAFKAQRKLPEAIQQLALACELEPYNNSLHGRWEALCREAKQTLPPATPSRAALGVLNFKTGLYRQAIQELTAILQNQPERVDLQLVLAEAYWRLDKKIEAASLSEKILAKLPHSIKANAILAEVWLRTGRVAGARRPLQLLQGLTQPTQSSCDADQPEGRAFLTKGSIPIAKQLQIAYFAKEVEEEAFRTTSDDEWSADLAFEDEELYESSEDGEGVEVDFFALLDSNDGGGSLFAFDTADDEESTPNWTGMEGDESEETAKIPSTHFDFLDLTEHRTEEPTEDEADVPDWLVEMDTGPLSKKEAADVPDWIRDTAERDTPLADGDRPDWLMEMETMAEDDYASNLFMSDEDLATLSHEQDPFDQRNTPQPHLHPQPPKMILISWTIGIPLAHQPLR